MKRFFCFLALLCFFFGVGAQENTTINAGAGMVDPLKIGDSVPSVALSGLINGAGLSGKDLSVFKGKLLILDFWATWCAPCVSVMPRLDSLQEIFREKLQFLPVAYESEAEVRMFLDKRRAATGRGAQGPIITGDKKLAALFPHQSLPHFVWIGTDGTVKAITDDREVTAARIRAMLALQAAPMPLKRDSITAYDHTRPLFGSGAPVANTLMQASLSPYIEGIGSGIYKDVDLDSGEPARRITARNQTITDLFRLAYQKEQKETLVEVADTTALLPPAIRGRAYLDWLKAGHGYCYELLLPEKEKKEAYRLMRGQLQSYFNAYEAHVEKRKVTCLVLVRTDNRDRLHTSGGTPSAAIDGFSCDFESCYLYVFLSRMKIAMQGYPYPLVDQTGYQEMADIRLSARMNDLNDVNRALAAYGLRFEKKPAEISMLIIRDAGSPGH